MESPGSDSNIGAGPSLPPEPSNPRSTTPPAPPAPPQEPSEERAPRVEAPQFEQVGEPIEGVQPETLDDLPDFIPPAEREPEQDGE